MSEETDWGVTQLHPMGLVAVLVLGTALVLLPRRYAIIPMIVLACFIPSAQRLVIMGNDFTLLRILIVFAWTRLVIRNEFSGFRWNRLDVATTAWKVSGTLIYTLSYGTTSALVNRCGWTFDGLGMYFFFRCALREWKDVEFLIRAFMLISVPVALAFCLERATGRNVFSVFGGVPLFTDVREGKLRCQGAYSHAILAGCFWVGVMPWMLAQLINGYKWIGAIAILAALVVVANCASSTPILAFCFMVLGMLLYFARSQLRAIRWGVFLLAIVLHFARDKPIWHLISRINVVGGSTGWHRYNIMDATIKNFDKWWLLGEKDPMSWGVSSMNDITNQYILECLRGGLLALTCFVIMIGLAFDMVGRALGACEKDDSRRLLVWSIGVSLFIHVCIYFSVSYFGQIIMLWYLTLAMIGSLPTIIGNDVDRGLPGGGAKRDVPETNDHWGARLNSGSKIWN